MGYDLESSITIFILISLISVYLYILFSPNQPHLPAHKRSFVIPPDTLEAFQTFSKGDSSYTWSDKESSGFISEYAKGPMEDDFFLFNPELEGNGATFPDAGLSASKEPNVPSSNFHCSESWMVIRSQLNYKFLWMHTASMWMAAGATIDTPMHHKSFKLSPVDGNCQNNGGWVVLQEGDSSSFIFMVPPALVQAAENIPSGTYPPEEWTVQLGTTDIQKAKADRAYHFLIETDGYLMNNLSMAFLNVIAGADYPVRGHSGGWDSSSPARREYGATLQFEFINASIVEAAIQKETIEEKEAAEQDIKLISQIQTFPKSAEKRVISFGLYGSNPKYTVGAIHNVEAAKIYFPGWICRFYITSDVPDDIVVTLKKLGAEIEQIPSGKGYISGMFWRFLVASDPTVDRFIIRDSDSRMNARDRYNFGLICNVLVLCYAFFTFSSNKCSTLFFS
jgi:hypothetical protein